MKLESFAIGDPCPKCGAPLTRRPDAYYWRGEYHDGAYCDDHKALWPIRGEEIPPLRPDAEGDRLSKPEK